MIYTACLKGEEETIHYFGRGESIEKALYDFKANGALDELKEEIQADYILVGVYESVSIYDKDLDDEHRDMMESEGWDFINTDLIHEVTL
jgi:hypothetical protein